MAESMSDGSCSARRRADVRPAVRGDPCVRARDGLRVEIVAQLPHPELNAYVGGRSTSGGAGHRSSVHAHEVRAVAGAVARCRSTTVSGRDDRRLLAAAARALAHRRTAPAGSTQPRRAAAALPPRSVRGSARSSATSSRIGRPLGVPTPGPSWRTSRRSSRGRRHYGLSVPGPRLRAVRHVLRAAGRRRRRALRRSLRPAFDSARRGVGGRVHRRSARDAARDAARAAGWHYDEISAAFREGRAAMVCDWPGSYHLYTDPATCRVADRVGPRTASRGPGRAARRLCRVSFVRHPARRAEPRRRGWRCCGS